MRYRHFIYVALLILPAVSEAVSAPVERLALVGGMVIDGYPGPPLHHATVLIEGSKIKTVGPAEHVVIPPGTTIIDTSGRTVLPGLIDAHVHLTILGHGDYDQWLPWIAKRSSIERAMEISARQLLMAGVTTAVDLGGPLQASLSVRDRIARNEIPGPHMLISGPWITRTSGPFDPDAMSIVQKLVHNPEEAARAAGELAAAGVDVIKAHAGLTRDDYAAIVKVAHEHGLRVHAHVYNETDVRNALDTGVDVLSHVGSAGMAPPYSQQLITDIVNAARPVVITAAHRSWIFPDTVAFPERLQDPQLKADFSAIPGLWEEVQHSLENFRALSYFARVDREEYFRERGVRQFIDAGAIVGMGTDSGTPMNFHTEALWREIKAHVDMGMPPQRAIMAATRVNAYEVLRTPDRGTISPGKLADVIVVRGDPLFDITALGNVEVVVKDGKVLKGADRPCSDQPMH